MPTNIAWTDGKTSEEIEEQLDGKFHRRGGAECWDWTAASNEEGYGRIRIEDRLRYAHRVSYRLFKGSLDEDEQVNHKCDNPSCINPSHLYKGTQKENIQDAISRGGFVENKPRGESHPKTTLEEEEIKEIRRRYDSGDVTHRELAEEYGVFHTTIGNIVRGETWPEV